MRTTFKYRLKRNLIVLTIVVFIIVYACFIGNQTSQKYISPKILIKLERKDPFRFKLLYAWAWNDDVIYIENQDGAVNNESNDELGNEVNESKNSSYRNPSVDSDYGQSRYLGVEGVEDYILSKDDYHEPRKPVTKRIQKCSYPLNNVLFLKTHHTGSDVITNILNRYADLRDLKVAIPSRGVSTFYWPARFHWRHLDLSIVDGILPNILCNHARYNPDVMSEIMPPGTAYVTMLRHPFGNFEATFRNEDFAGLLDMYEFSDPVGAFLENPKYYIQRIVRRRTFKDILNLIKNGMFFDLGLRTADYHKPDIVKDAILDIDDKFTVVLIYEYLDESLLLLKRKLCWELDDVLYLKTLLATGISTRKYTATEIDSLKKWSKADFLLYEHFNATLWKTISYEKEFFEELKAFRAKNLEIEQDCSRYSYSTSSHNSELNNIEPQTKDPRIDSFQNVELSYIDRHERLSQDVEPSNGVSRNIASPETMPYIANPYHGASRQFGSRNLMSYVNVPSRNVMSQAVKQNDNENAIPRMNQYYCHKMTISSPDYLEYFRTKFANNKH